MEFPNMIHELCRELLVCCVVVFWVFFLLLEHFINFSKEIIA